VLVLYIHMCIEEVPGLNLCWRTGCPDLCYSWFSLVLPGVKCQDIALHSVCFHPNPFQFTNPDASYHYVIWGTDTIKWNTKWRHRPAWKCCGACSWPRPYVHVGGTFG